MGSLLNSLIFSILVMSMLIGTQDIVRWRVVALAVMSVIVNSSLHEFMPGVLGAVVTVLATVAFVAVGLVSWCEIEWRPALRIVAAYFGCSLVLSVFSALLERFST